MNLFNGDCLELMADIPDGSIDMVLADPPYGTTQCKWDSIIPLDEMWKQLKRVTKPSGAIVLMGQGMFTARLQTSSPFYRYSLIYEKGKAGGFLNARRMPLQAHEDITIHYQKLPVYNPQMTIGKPYSKKNISNGDGGNYVKFERVGKTCLSDGERFPRSVLKFSNPNKNSLHPTQKPVELMEYLIKTYTNEDDTVFDFCMGSGTTGVAAQNLNRKFYGIEKYKTYFDIACKRIEETIYR